MSKFIIFAVKTAYLDPRVEPEDIYGMFRIFLSIFLRPLHNFSVLKKKIFRKKITLRPITYPKHLNGSRNCPIKKKIPFPL